MTAAHALMATVSNKSGGTSGAEAVIFAGVVCAGLGFGIVWPLIVVLAGDFFGLENLGVGVDVMSACVCSFFRACSRASRLAIYVSRAWVRKWIGSSSDPSRRKSSQLLLLLLLHIY